MISCRRQIASANRLTPLSLSLSLTRFLLLHLSPSPIPQRDSKETLKQVRAVVGNTAATPASFRLPRKALEIAISSERKVIAAAVS